MRIRNSTISECLTVRALEFETIGRIMIGKGSGRLLGLGLVIKNDLILDMFLK